MKASLSIWKITLLISLFITVLGNFSFWDHLTRLISWKQEPLLLLCFFIVIATVINLLLTIISFKPIFKGIAITLLMSSAFSAYFMDNYAVMIDKTMIRNVLSTDVNEAREFFSIRLLVTIILLGILPSCLLFKIKIDYKPFFKGLILKSAIGLICITVIVGTLYSNYQELSFFGRNNRELRHLINPINYIFPLNSLIKRKLFEDKIVVKAIEDDAKIILRLDKPRKPSLVILVLGETARAMNFSLNGYTRDTNPLLKNQEIINFSDVTSCGTATAVSLPCMLSKFSRKEFSDSKAKQHENLLDVVSHAGYQVLWRDNNTGCQGSCERIHYEGLSSSNNQQYCESGNCVDEILLDKLQGIVTKTYGDKLIVLHQKGNHGPTYHLRYPPRFEVFKPACKTNQLRSCSKEEIVNAYDNAILYGDYFLSQSINFLKSNSNKFNTALVYISDHGESLGENNLYLHGLPYMIAPDEQKKVPFLLWLSDGYQKTYEINKACVALKASEKLSHDNLFSSMLGLLAIKTNVHNSALDIFYSCQKKQVAIIN